MRARSWVGGVWLVVAACGGKIAPTDDAAEPPSELPAPVEKPPSSPTSCAPARLTTDDFGVVDVSQLECPCADDDDCTPGHICAQMPGVAEARCTAVRDPCHLVECGGTCIVFEGAARRPVCYR